MPAASPTLPRSPFASTPARPPGDLDLAPDVEAQVFRIVQEALTNVRKHSGARRVEISFAAGDGSFDVVIADDGHGITGAAAPADLPRYGIEAMRERAQSIAGTVDWTSPATGGCRVELRVAVETSPEPAPLGVT